MVSITYKHIACCFDSWALRTVPFIPTYNVLWSERCSLYHVLYTVWKGEQNNMTISKENIVRSPNCEQTKTPHISYSRATQFGHTSECTLSHPQGRTCEHLGEKLVHYKSKVNFATIFFCVFSGGPKESVHNITYHLTSYIKLKYMIYSAMQYKHTHS